MLLAPAQPRCGIVEPAQRGDGEGCRMDAEFQLLEVPAFQDFKVQGHMTPSAKRGPYGTVRFHLSRERCPRSWTAVASTFAVIRFGAGNKSPQAIKHEVAIDRLEMLRQPVTVREQPSRAGSLTHHEIPTPPFDY